MSPTHSFLTYLKSRLGDILAAAILAALVLWIGVNNFQTNTWFIGWDALNPELNFGFNISQALNPTWQENYGVGTQTGHGFAATLPHTLALQILALFLPTQHLRFVFTFLCLYLGAFGVFRVVSYALNQNEKSLSSQLGKKYIWLAAFMASLFYIFNPGTTQIFYLQLEAFIVQFAALPWLLLTVLEFLDKPNFKKAWLLFIVSWLGSVQGFIPSLFISYALGVWVILIFFVGLSKFNARSFKTSFLVIFITFLANAYWFIPIAYYLGAQNTVFLNSYNNLISTPEFVAKSHEYGTLTNVVYQRSFFLESKYQNQFVFEPWLNHYQQPLTRLVALLLVMLAGIGLVSSFFLFQNWKIAALNGFSLYFLLSLTTTTWPFSLFSQVLYFLSPTYEQAFRTTFTKFGIGWSLGLSCLIGFGFICLIRLVALLKKHWLTDIFSNIAFVVVAVAIFIYGFPHLAGHSLFSKLQLTMPEAYSEVIKYFKTQPRGRIADLPTDCAEGWYSYNWGYFGSGFYWYAFPQAVMSRSFDVWSNHNEAYYLEMSSALQRKDFATVVATLDKYQINWVLIDQNAEHCASSTAFSYTPELIQYLEKSQLFSVEKNITNSVQKPITILKRTQPLSLFQSFSHLPKIDTGLGWGDQDRAYTTYGSYIETSLEPDVNYPFSHLFDRRGNNQNNYQLNVNEDQISLTKVITSELHNAKVVLPNTAEILDPVFVEFAVNESQELTVKTIQPEFFLNNQKLTSVPTSEIELTALPSTTFQPVIALNQFEVVPNQPLAISLRDENKVTIFNPNGSMIKEITNLNTLLTSQTTTMAPVTLSLKSDDQFKVVIPKVSANPKSFTSLTQTQYIPQNCVSSSEGDNRYELGQTNIESTSYQFLRMITHNNAQCIFINVGENNLPSNYLVEVLSRHVAGQPLHISASDTQGHQVLNIPLNNDQNFSSEYFVMPQTFDQINLLTLKNQSFNSTESIQDVVGLKFWAFPTNMLQNIHLLKPNLEAKKPTVAAVESTQIFPTIYKIEHAPSGNTILELTQGFHSGWLAFDLNSKSFLSKNNINGWANGWNISDSTGNIMIIFWPTLLGWVGYSITIISASILILLWLKQTLKKPK